jgi:AbrB family looped-hinge helix DNA binding protein
MAMKEHLTVITRKGQVTLPVEIRRRLGLKEGDKVAFVEDEQGIRVVRPESVVARTAGILKSELPMAPAEAERQAAEQAIAEEVVRRMER